jgi:hypothetical protein
MTRRLHCFSAVAILLASSAARADTSTDEIEVTAFGGAIWRQAVISPPAPLDSRWAAAIGVGALGGVEVAYRHDFATWSFASGLRLQHESYERDGWLSNGPNAAHGGSNGDYIQNVESFRETMTAIGIPLRAQVNISTAVVGYFVAEPMIVAHVRSVLVETSRATHLELGGDRQLFAVYAAGGLGVRAGPGSLVVEIGGREGVQTHFGDQPSSPSGWSLMGGYRVGVR